MHTRIHSLFGLLSRWATNEGRTIVFTTLPDAVLKDIGLDRIAIDQSGAH
jgi:hypothetical protein